MTNPFLMTDFYKLCHMMQFRENIVGFTSYLVPRGNRTVTFGGWTIFGVQDFVYELNKTFNEKFFSMAWDAVASDISFVLTEGLGYKKELIDKTLAKIKKLYDIGYLPIIIKAIPEGTEVPMGCPVIEISTTSEEVPWIGQAIESWLSCAIWHPSMSATVGKAYAKICKAAYDLTVDGGDYHRACCDFSMRGQESYQSAVASAAGWLTAMYNSSTVGAKEYVYRNYSDGRLGDSVIIGGLTSTEHSVMCSDFALCGDERETYKRLLTEVYPDVSFAAVCDSYDFWHVLTEVLPSLRDEIEAHEGFLGVRHDSAEPVSALCGIETYTIELNKISLGDIDIKDATTEDIEIALSDYVYDYFYEDAWQFYNESVKRGEALADNFEIRVKFKNNKDEIVFDKVFAFEAEYCEERGSYTNRDYLFVESVFVSNVRDTTYEDRGMVETLGLLFGETLNEKGYLVINTKLKAVYGDSITLQRAKKIFERLAAKGYAANNVSLGVGSFSMECIEENGELKPFTRDTFSIAIKATCADVKDENGEVYCVPIFKNPKNFAAKKSLKGFAVPYRDKNGNITYKDNLSAVEYSHLKDKNLMKEYYHDGTVIFDSFNEIRRRVDMEVSK